MSAVWRAHRRLGRPTVEFEWYLRNGVTWPVRTHLWFGP